MIEVRIASEAIEPAALEAALPRDASNTGAVVAFTGYVRGEGISAMALEHYPGMTEQSIEECAGSAMRRWPLQSVHVVHRVGELLPGDPIVWLAVAARHRAAAFSGCEYVMDYLKVSAPLWKRERDMHGQWRWVPARDSDTARARRWGAGSGSCVDS